MSADAITTCPNCLERELREEHDLYCESADGLIVTDDEDPPVKPVKYIARIKLNCRVCAYQAELMMSSPLLLDVMVGTGFDPPWVRS